MQAFRSMRGLPRFIVMAFAGQIFAHFAADAVLRAQLREGREHMELHAVGKSGKRPLSAAAEKTLVCEGTVL